MADSSTTTQKAAAEAIGTFVLVFIGCLTLVLSQDLVATGLAFGLTFVAGAYAFGRISGAHFNPAVTTGAALGGRMAWAQWPVYVGAQLLGGLVAGLALWIVLHGIDGYSSKGSIGQSGFGDHGPEIGFSWWGAFLLELILTAVLVWVILALTDSRNEHPAFAPLAIGLTFGGIYLASVALTNGGANPARSIGVGVFAGTDAIVQQWVFIIAPLLGGAAAGLLYPLVFGHGTEPVPGSGLSLGQPQAAAPGYGAPDQFQQEWNQQALATEAVAEQAWAAEPIIQDGWQWDHQAQEWRPLEQWQPAEPVAAAEPVAPTPAPTPTPTQGIDDTQVAASPVQDPPPYQSGQPGSSDQQQP